MAGKGHIEKRGKNSYRLVVSCGMGPDGKQIKKTRTVKAVSKREAEKLLAEFVTEIEKGMFIWKRYLERIPKRGPAIQ